MKKELKLSNKAFELIESFEDISNRKNYEESEGTSLSYISELQGLRNNAYNALKDYIIKLEQDNKNLKKEIK